MKSRGRSSRVNACARPREGHQAIERPAARCSRLARFAMRFGSVARRYSCNLCNRPEPASPGGRVRQGRPPGGRLSGTADRGGPRPHHFRRGGGQRGDGFISNADGHPRRWPSIRCGRGILLVADMFRIVIAALLSLPFDLFGDRQTTGGRPGSSCRLYRPWSDAVRSGANVRVSPSDSDSHFHAKSHWAAFCRALVVNSIVSGGCQAAPASLARSFLQSAYPLLRFYYSGVSTGQESGPGTAAQRDSPRLSTPSA